MLLFGIIIICLETSRELSRLLAEHTILVRQRTTEIDGGLLRVAILDEVSHVLVDLLEEQMVVHPVSQLNALLKVAQRLVITLIASAQLCQLLVIDTKGMDLPYCLKVLHRSHICLLGTCVVAAGLEDIAHLRETSPHAQRVMSGRIERESLTSIVKRRLQAVERNVNLRSYAIADGKLLRLRQRTLGFYRLENKPSPTLRLLGGKVDGSKIIVGTAHAFHVVPRLVDSQACGDSFDAGTEIAKMMIKCPNIRVAVADAS